MRISLPGVIIAFLRSGYLFWAGAKLVIDPASPLEKFSATKPTVKALELRHLPSDRPKYYELWVTGEDGRAFFIRQPLHAELARYREAIPVGIQVVARFISTSDGDRLLDLRSDDMVYIALADTLRSEAQKHRLILIFAGLFAVIGFAALAWHISVRRKARARA